MPLASSTASTLIPAPPNKVSRYILLDMLRGLAALWIFTTHLPEYMAAYHPQIGWFSSRGYLAVMTFFIISGYAVTASLYVSREAGESVWRFVYRRMRRIYMPYWLALPVLVALPWVATWLGQLTHQAVPLVAPFTTWDIWPWIRYITLFQIFYVWYEPPDFIHPVFTLVLWTLAIEVQFYLMMFLSYGWTRRVKVLLILLTIPCIPLMFYLLMELPPWLRGWVFAYWPVFGMGMVLYLLDRRGWTPMRVFKWPRWVSCIPLLILPCTIIATLKFEEITTGMPMSSSQVALWLWFWMDFKDEVNHLPRSRFWVIRWPFVVLLFIGHMSYTIYLFHLPMRYTVEVLVNAFLWPQSRLFAPTIIVITLVICIPFYWFCERPFAKLPLKPATPRPDPPDRDLERESAAINEKI